MLLNQGRSRSLKIQTLRTSDVDTEQFWFEHYQAEHKLPNVELLAVFTRKKN